MEVSDHQRVVAVSGDVEGAGEPRGVAEEEEGALVEERGSWWSHTDMKVGIIVTIIIITSIVNC